MSSRRKKILWILGGAAIGFIAVLIALSVVISRRAHVWAADWMAEQYHSQVQLDAFRVAIPFPLVQCEGENLVLHFQGRQDLPPLDCRHALYHANVNMGASSPHAAH